MVVKLVKAWLGQSIGDEVNVLAGVGEMMIAQGVATIVDPNEYPVVKKVSAELTRPATTTTYDAGDAILGNVTAVKQKETLTLSGTFGTAEITGAGGLTRTISFVTSLTLTASGFVTANVAAYLAAGITLTSSGADLVFESATAGVLIVPPVITNPTSDLAGTVTHTTANRAAVKQKDTLTLTGASGTAILTGITPSPKTITYSVSPTQTATNFTTANAAEYLTYGVVLTSSGADLIFEANVAGVAFTHPVLSFTASTLAGTVANTTATRAAVAQVDIVTLAGVSGTANMTGVGGVTKLITFATSLKVTADNFVVDHAAAYTAVGITVTAGTTNTLIFTANVAGTALVTAVVTNVTVDLAGTTATSVANVTAIKKKDTITVSGTTGYAQIAAAGGLTKTITFNTDLTTTNSAFVTAFAADYLAQGIVLTSSTVNLIFEANVAGTDFTSPTITTLVNIQGTWVATAASVTAIQQVETMVITGTFGQATIAAAGGLTLVATFDTSLTKTLANFVTANQAGYDAQGILILSAGNTLMFYAKVTGTGFTAPTITVKANLAGTVVATTANVSLSALQFVGAAKQKGAGGRLVMVKVATNMTMFAGKTIRLWFSASEPKLTVGDNIAYVNNYANAGVSDFYVNIVFDALLASSDMVYGQVLPAQPMPYSTEDKTLYCLIQSIDGALTPTSGGKIMLNAYFER